MSVPDATPANSKADLSLFDGDLTLREVELYLGPLVRHFRQLASARMNAASEIAALEAGARAVQAKKSTRGSEAHG